MSILYTGLDPKQLQSDKKIVHVPFIQIVPRSLSDPELIAAFQEISFFSHIILTSPTAARLFFQILKSLSLSIDHQVGIPIGRVTAHEMEKRGLKVLLIPKQENQEGLIEELNSCSLSNSFLFYPRSRQARPLLSDFLKQKAYKVKNFDLYDTKPLIPNPLPNLEAFSEVYFSSPSTLKSFLSVYKKIPDHLTVRTKGMITKGCL